MSQIFLMLVAVLAPALATFLFTKFVTKKIVPWIDTRPALLQQILVVVEAAIFTKLGTLLGLSLPLDIHGFSADTLAGLINGLAAIAAHAIWKTNTVAATRLPSSTGK